MFRPELADKDEPIAVDTPNPEVIDSPEMLSPLPVDPPETLMLFDADPIDVNPVLVDIDRLVESSWLESVAPEEGTVLSSELDATVPVERLDVERIVLPGLVEDPRGLVSLLDIPFVAAEMPGEMFGLVDPVDDAIVGAVMLLTAPTIKDVEAARAVDLVPVARLSSTAASTFSDGNASSNCAL
jgi:hypothetical protein